MIYHKAWEKQRRRAGRWVTCYYKGWFLLGFIPLYIIRIKTVG